MNENEEVTAEMLAAMPSNEVTDTEEIPDQTPEANIGGEE